MSGLQDLANYLLSMQQMTHMPESSQMRLGRQAADLIRQQMMQRFYAPVSAIGGLKDITSRAMEGEDVSVDPLAGGQLLRGLSWIGSGNPMTLPFKPLPKSANAPAYR